MNGEDFPQWKWAFAVWASVLGIKHLQIQVLFIYSQASILAFSYHLPSPPLPPNLFWCFFWNIKRYKVVNFICWFNLPIKALLCYSRHRSCLVVFAVPSILSSVASPQSFPLSGRTHLFLCFLPWPRLGVCFLPVHRRRLYFPSICRLSSDSSACRKYIQYISFKALLKSHLFQVSLQSDPQQFGGGGKTTLRSLICL